MARPTDRRYKGMRAKAPVGIGRISEERIAWTRLSVFNIVVYRKRGEFSEDIPPGDIADQYESVITPDGDEVIILIEAGNNRVMINFSSLTQHELTTLKNLFDVAVDEAMPIVEARDKVATEVLNEYDDDSHARIYRGVPEVFIRKGASGEYNPRIRERLEGAHAVVRYPGYIRGLGDVGLDVADTDSNDDISEHTEP